MNWIVYGIRLILAIGAYVGFWKIFKKLGRKGFWSLIPVAREYKLAETLGKEQDGAVWCVTNAASEIFILLSETMKQLGKTDLFSYDMLTILSVIFGITNIVFGVRIFSELCMVFNRKKTWVWLWILFDEPASMIWGLSNKFVPEKLNTDDIGEAASISGKEVKILDKGLSININERVATNFFKKKTLLRDIHMNIAPGNMVLLLGGSGAGKTTFLNAVTGYEKADAKIYLNGMDVYKRFDKMQYEIGFVPQQDLIRYNDSVVRTLTDAATLRLPTNVKRKDRNKRVDEVLDIFGLTSVKNNIVGKQSGGQKKRISIATEFISDPALFILDEPDSGLDGIMARDLMSRLHDISRQGKIVIVITHTPDRVIDLFDKVIVLAKDGGRTGRLVYYGDVDKAKTFFGVSKMEDIIKKINCVDEGGEGKADELIEKYTEVCDEQ